MSAFIDYDELRAMAAVRDTDHEHVSRRCAGLLPEIVKEIDRLREKVHRRDNKISKLRTRLSENRMNRVIEEQSAEIRKQGQYIERLKMENRRLRIVKGFTRNVF